VLTPGRDVDEGAVRRRADHRHDRRGRGGRDDSDAVWLTATDFLTPTTLSMAEIGQQPEVLKSNPVFFDGSKDGDRAALRHQSKDGTKVPYFLVRPKA
jgi:prolyl oligopeptidase PreP (S9A serine peptidase family)